MAEGSTTDEASAKLTDAIRDLIREVNGTPSSTSANVTPGIWNVFFLVLLVANLSFLIYLIPANLLEGPHWELLKESIPAVGGSLFVLIASWYKDWTLRVSNTPHFRITQGVVTVVFVFSLLIPWLHIKPRIEPRDAQVLLDDDLEPIDVSSGVWLTMKGHSFSISRNWDPEKPHPRQFRLGWRELLRAEFGGEQPRWALCYRAVFKSETPGITLKIVPDRTSALDREFLRFELAQHSLLLAPNNSLTLSLPAADATLGATQLPVGHYWVSATKSGCTDGPAQEVTVGPAVNKAENPPTKVPGLQCRE